MIKTILIVLVLLISVGYVYYPYAPLLLAYYAPTFYPTQ